MAKGGSLTHEPQCLAPLVEYSDLLEFHPVTGRVRAVDKLPPILDQNRIPQRVPMIRQALATIAIEHKWSGEYDLHHLAYEGRKYKEIVAKSGERVGSYYRGSALLKVILPRQLHEYVHIIYEEPPIPDLDVIHMFGEESNYVHDLYNAIRHDSYRALPELKDLSFDQQEELRAVKLREKLDIAPKSEFGIIPNIEILSQLELREARKILRGLARAAGFSNVPQCQEVFYGSELMTVA